MYVAANRFPILNWIFNQKLYLEEVMERTFKSSRENDIYSEDLYSLHIEQLLAANQSEQGMFQKEKALWCFSVYNNGRWVY